MEIYLYTVEERWLTPQGTLILKPGIGMLALTSHPELKHIMPGKTPLELRRPDGTRRTTLLVNYGIAVEKDEEGAIIFRGDIHNPVAHFYIPGDLTPDDVPPGTEIWWVKPE